MNINPEGHNHTRQNLQNVKIQDIMPYDKITYTKSPKYINQGLNAQGQKPKNIKVQK